jgi:hypothetical protein
MMPVYDYGLSYSRPHTIKDALRLVAQGYPRQVVFGDFADWLYLDADKEKVEQAIAAKPDIDAFDGELYYEYVDYLSFGEWLARRDGISVPEWILADKSVVSDSSYTPRMLEYRNRMLSLFADRALPEYRRRGIYMTENNLVRG